MDSSNKQFREWKSARERELTQLRRQNQKQTAAMQQFQNLHAKQQAVLKRKTQEAEAARKRLRVSDDKDWIHWLACSKYAHMMHTASHFVSRSC